MFTWAKMYTFMNIYIFIYVYIYKHTNTHAHTAHPSVCSQYQSSSANICTIYICSSIHTRTQTHTHTHTHSTPISMQPRIGFFSCRQQVFFIYISIYRSLIECTLGSFFGFLFFSFFIYSGLYMSFY